MHSVRITEYTDPGCPWAYSAEPYRRRLQWLYGNDIDWHVRMVVLADSPDDYIERGLTLDEQAAAYTRISREHGMPIDTRQRPRMAATRPACRAVVAARLGQRLSAPPPARRAPAAARRPRHAGDGGRAL